MKNILAFPLLVLASLGLYAADRDWASIVAEASSAVCKIELMSGKEVLSSGSGFAIDREGRVMTNAHVVREAKNDDKISFRVTFPSSTAEYHDVSIESISDMPDCAIIDVHSPLQSALSISPIQNIGVMTEVVAIGYPLGKNIKTTPGFVQALQKIPGIGDMLDLSASVDPGSSGGPVIGRDGNVVGMVTANIPGYNFNLALPARVLNGFRKNVRDSVEVRITSDPSDGLVFANGSYLGKTPLTVRLYGIDLELSVEREGYEPQKRNVSADTTKSTDERFVLEPKQSSMISVLIDTVPSGGTIWVDNVEIGKGPVTYQADRGARMRIRAKLRGYKELNTVKSADEKDQKIRLDLEKSRF
jgi:V8-like Glu-specific endopeptidase